MSTPEPFDHDELIRRISRDLADGYDEEFEMEIEDRHPLSAVSSPGKATRKRPTGAIIFSSCFACRPNS